MTSSSTDETGVSCPVCDTPCANDHGLRVHFGMVHCDPSKQASELQAAGVVLEDALQKLTGDDPDVDQWTDADLEGLATLVSQRSVDLHEKLAEHLDTETADGPDPTDYPGRRPETGPGEYWGYE